jgi:hypothetical protein
MSRRLGSLLAVWWLAIAVTAVGAQILPIGGGVGDAAITAGKIADGAVTTAKIADTAVVASSKLSATFTNVTYASGNYVGSGSQTWTVDEGDVETHVTLVMGKVLVVSWSIYPASVGGTPSTQLRLGTGGYTWAKGCNGVHTYIDGAATRGAGRTVAVAGTNYVVLYTAPASNWSAATNTNGTWGSLICEVQ